MQFQKKKCRALPSLRVGERTLIGEILVGLRIALRTSYGRAFPGNHHEVRDADRYLTLLDSGQASGATLGLRPSQNEVSTRCGPNLNVGLLTQAGRLAASRECGVDNNSEWAALYAGDEIGIAVRCNNRGLATTSLNA